MITFYVTSHYWEDDSADILDYTKMSEHDIAEFISEHPNDLVKIEPSAYKCAFREKFIEQHLDNGYVQEGVFFTKLNGCTIDFRIIENINAKLSRVKTLMELKYDDVFYHTNRWFWGKSIDIVKDNGTAIVCVKFDEKTFPKAGYICDLSVLESERRKGLGDKMMKYALMSCADNRMTFARLHVDAKNTWLREWYERLGFKELSMDENEIEMIKEL